MKQFDFWGYSGPTDGTYTIDGELFDVGQDFRTVERLKEYKAAGMNIYFPQSAGQYHGEEWQTSTAKTLMDKAHEAGLDRVILNDRRIQKLSEAQDGVIGQGKIVHKKHTTDMDKFENESQLDAYITDCMKDYSKHPCFYGVMVVDEPSYALLKTVGQVYRSIKRVRPNTFVQCCLFPPIPALDKTVRPLENYTSDTFENWKKYLQGFVENTGADYIMYDQYPISERGIHASYIKGMQTAARFCNENNLKFYFAAQSIWMRQPGAVIRAIKKADGYWITNMAMGFGVKAIAYFTYWTKQTNTTNNEMFLDDGSFVNRNGTKTDIYNFMQQIMGEMQRFAPTILDFEYKNSTVYTADAFTYYTTSLVTNIKKSKLDKIKNLHTDKETVLVTELTRKSDKQYMYMVQNIIDGYNIGEVTVQNITVTFCKGYSHVIVYDKAEERTEKLNNGSITVKLTPGQAYFLMPIKTTKNN